MRRPGGVRRRWRGAASLPVAALAVHQLRYLLAYGSQYGHELDHRGDAYVGWLTPACVVLVALVLGAGLGRAAEAWRTGAAAGARPPRLGWRTLWAAITLTLIACFCVQEWLELALEPTHAGTVTGVFASGGWTALPAAAAVAAIVVMLIRGAGVALDALARWGRARRGALRPCPAAAGHRPRRGHQLHPAPLASCSAGRAPPPAATAAAPARA